MPDYGTVYRDIQGRIMSLVNRQNASTPVPACPQWTVHDLVAHLAGVLDDLAKGRIEDAGSDPWTERQVAERKDRSVAEIMAEWHLQANTNPQLFNHPGMPRIIVDLVTHEHDLRAAIGKPGYRTHRMVKTAARTYLSGLDAHFREEKRPALRFDLSGEDIVVGEGEPQGTVHLSWFEAFRMVSGRRTPSQVRSLTWDGDPDTWIDHLFVLGPATIDQVE